MALLDPKEISITDAGGNTKSFIISRVPSTYSKEIFVNYPSNAIPKIGVYKVHEEMSFKLLSYTEVVQEGVPNTRLMTRALVDNHTTSMEMMLRLEAAMMEYNYGFFLQGAISAFSKNFTPKTTAWATKILTGFLEQLSQKIKPHSTN